MRLKDSSGIRWSGLYRGIAWACLLVLLSGFFVNPSYAMTCKPSAIYYSTSNPQSAGDAPWNQGKPPNAWRTCTKNYTYDGVASCCKTNEIGMTQGQFLNESFRLTAISILAVGFHGFFITANIVIRRNR